MKECTSCKEHKELNFFYKNSKTNIYESMCKTCRLEYRKKYSTSNKIANKKWRLKNSDKIKSDKKQYYRANRDHLIAKVTNRLNDFKEQYGISYQSALYQNNINSKIKICLRSRLNAAIRNNQKTGSAISDLGCSIDELKKHLESRFTEGMSWDNYGEWHIDHIRPLASFNLLEENEVKLACHYTNLQPLWARDNLSKGGSYRLTKK